MSEANENSEHSFCLHIVGTPGRGEEHLLSQAEKMQSKGIAKLWGFCTDVAAAYSTADVLLVASCYETLSLVMLDAIRYGVAIITSPINGTEELLANDNGVLVEASSAAFAKALIDLAGNRARLDAKGRQSRLLADQFSARVLAQKTLSAYQHTLTGSSHPTERLR